MEAAQGGMMEVQLGSYAQQNALSERVKAFGAMMVRDHSKANDELKSIATTKSITLPADMSNSKDKKEMDELMKKTGKDFDKAYMKMMVDDHKKDVKAFEDASKDVKDTELKNFASSTLPVLKVHLDSAKAIAGKY
jgi:putative membrane protein